MLDDDVGDADALAKIDGQRTDALEQCTVERGARDTHRVVAVGPKCPDRAVSRVQDRPVRRRDAHTGERRRAAGVDGLQHAEPVEHAAGLGTQVLPADFRPRARPSVEHGHAEAVLGEEDGRRRPRGAGADDHDVGVRHHAASTTTRASHGYRVTVARVTPAAPKRSPSSAGAYARRTESGPS